VSRCAQGLEVLDTGLPAARVRHTFHRYYARLTELDPRRELVLVGAGSYAEIGLCPVPMCQKWRAVLCQPDAHARVLTEQIDPATGHRAKLVDGNAHIVDLTASAMATADARDPGKKELVGAAHTNSLERAFGPASRRRRQRGSSRDMIERQWI